MNGQHLKAWFHSPVPRFQPSTPAAVGTGPDYKACSSQEGFRGSWTKTDGRTHSCHSPHAPRCRRSDVGGSPGHSWLSTGGENKSLAWTVFLIGKRGEICHFRITWFKDDDLNERSFLRVKFCLLRANWLFKIKISMPLEGLYQVADTQPLWLPPPSIPLWSRWIHRHGCCSSLCLEVWSGSHSTWHAPPSGCGPHTARLAVYGPIHMTYYTVVEARQRLLFYKDVKLYMSGIRRNITTFLFYRCSV